MPSRRQLLRSAAAGAPALPASSLARASIPGPAAPATPRPGSIAVADLPRQFDVEPGIHNPENGYWGVMPRMVAEAYAGTAPT